MVIGPIASITHINFHLFFSKLTLVSWLKVSELKRDPMITENVLNLPKEW